MPYMEKFGKDRCCDYILIRNVCIFRPPPYYNTTIQTASNLLPQSSFSGTQTKTNALADFLYAHIDCVLCIDNIMRFKNIRLKTSIVQYLQKKLMTSRQRCHSWRRKAHFLLLHLFQTIKKYYDVWSNISIKHSKLTQQTNQHFLNCNFYKICSYYCHIIFVTVYHPTQYL